MTNEFCKTCEPSSSVVNCKDFGIVWNNKDQEKRNFLCVDPCLVPELLFLWKNGVVTYGSCCGHGKSDPVVIINIRQKDLIEKLGYHEFREISSNHSAHGDYVITLRSIKN